MEEQARDESTQGDSLETDEAGIFRGVTEVLETVAATARVESAFGEPYTAGGNTVIPVADVVTGLGFGMGSGGGTGPEGQGKGSGGGGGAGARARPVALVVINQEGVSIKPVIDVARLSLAGMAVTGFVIIWALRLLRAGQGTEANVKRMPSARAIQGLLKIGD